MNVVTQPATKETPNWNSKIPLRACEYGDIAATGNKELNALLELLMSYTISSIPSMIDIADTVERVCRWVQDVMQHAQCSAGIVAPMLQAPHPAEVARNTEWPKDIYSVHPNTLKPFPAKDFGIIAERLSKKMPRPWKNQQAVPISPYELAHQLEQAIIQSRQIEQQLKSTLKGEGFWAGTKFLSEQNSKQPFFFTNAMYALLLEACQNEHKDVTAVWRNERFVRQERFLNPERGSDFGKVFTSQIEISPRNAFFLARLNLFARAQKQQA